MPGTQWSSNTHPGLPTPLASRSGGVRPACITRAHIRQRSSRREIQVIILGLILLIIGMLVGVSLLTTIGGILIAVGAILWILGATGRAVGGRKHFF